MARMIGRTAFAHTGGSQQDPPWPHEQPDRIGDGYQRENDGPDARHRSAEHFANAGFLRPPLRHERRQAEYSEARDEERQYVGQQGHQMVHQSAFSVTLREPKYRTALTHKKPQNRP